MLIPHNFITNHWQFLKISVLKFYTVGHTIQFCSFRWEPKIQSHDWLSRDIESYLLIKMTTMYKHVVDTTQSRVKLDRGCPNGTNTPRGDNFSRYQNLHCDLDLWPFDLKIYRAHPCLMGSLHVKFYDDRSKGKAVMRRKPFSVIHALWPWPLAFWPQNL